MIPTLIIILFGMRDAILLIVAGAAIWRLSREERRVDALTEENARLAESNMALHASNADLRRQVAPPVDATPVSKSQPYSFINRSEALSSEEGTRILGPPSTRRSVPPRHYGAGQ